MTKGNPDAIELVPVSPDNYDPAMALTVREDQKSFVGTVQKSLADAYVYKEAVFRLAYCDDAPVGYLLLYPYDENQIRHVNIVRLMIDQKHQGRGLGRALLEAAIRLIASLQPPAEVVRNSTLPSNTVALALYRSRGFIERGIEDDEIALYLRMDA